MVVESNPGRPHLQASFPSGSQVYVDQPISISCSTSGNILVWESSEYIGHGGQLSFVLGERQGHKINSQINDHTFATLTSNQPELTSQLNLIVASNYPTFTIVCRNVEQGSTENVTYTISENEATQLFAPSQASFCLEDDLRIDCIARNTSALQLNTGFFNVTCKTSDLSVRNTTMAGVEVAVLQNYSAGSSLLNCSFVLKAAELPKDQQLFLVCSNVDIRTSTNTSIKVAAAVTDDCSSTSYIISQSAGLSSTSFATVLVLSVLFLSLYF